MVRVGLTGGIASGKSAVADLLRARGALIIDSDVLAREVVRPGTEGFDAVVRRFSSGVVNSDGDLDRAALGRIVFAEPAARRDLEAIIHPAVRRRAREIEAAAPADAVVIQVIPLLVETGQQESFDLCVVVDADPKQQLDRLSARTGLSPEEAAARIAAQASRETRLAAADLVVDNTGSKQQLTAQVDRLWQQLVGSA